MRGPASAQAACGASPRSGKVEYPIDSANESEEAAFNARARGAAGTSSTETVAYIDLRETRRGDVPNMRLKNRRKAVTSNPYSSDVVEGATLRSYEQVPVNFAALIGGQ